MRTSRSGSTARTIRCAAILLIVSALSGAVAAQQDAGIIGLVTDESGAVLPGVTVTATGPSLQVPSVAGVTDAKGEYLLSPLPIGPYTVEFGVSGFQGVKDDGNRRTVGFPRRTGG